MKIISVKLDKRSKESDLVLFMFQLDTMEFFLNGGEHSVNSANSENLINH